VFARFDDELKKRRANIQSGFLLVKRFGRGRVSTPVTGGHCEERSDEAISFMQSTEKMEREIVLRTVLEEGRWTVNNFDIETRQN